MNRREPAAAKAPVPAGSPSRRRQALRVRSTRPVLHARRAAHRLVVKVGSSLVTNDGRGLDHAAVARWAAQIAELQRARQGGRAGLVGRDRRGHASAWAGAAARRRCTSCRRRRPSARWGWCRPTRRAFAQFGLQTAQILLTHEDLADRRRYLNARSTLTHAARARRDPDHQRERHRHHRRDPLRRQRHARRAGDQPDRGRRRWCCSPTSRASTPPTRARTRRRRWSRDARAGDPALEAMAGGAGSALGQRRHADQGARRQARRALGRLDRHRQRPRGRRADAARRRRGDRHARSIADAASLAARKQWLADHLQLAGRLQLDAGAVRALVREGKSLLPIGVVAVDGEFERGEVVGCFDPDGREVARGLVNYGAADAAPHPAPALVRDRGDPRLRRRARAHPSRQPGAARLTAAPLAQAVDVHATPQSPACRRGSHGGPAPRGRCAGSRRAALTSHF